jgi:hypothetical protein
VKEILKKKSVGRYILNQEHYDGLTLYKDVIENLDRAKLLEKLNLNVEAVGPSIYQGVPGKRPLGIQKNQVRLRKKLVERWDIEDCSDLDLRERSERPTQDHLSDCLSVNIDIQGSLHVKAFTDQITLMVNQAQTYFLVEKLLSLNTETMSAGTTSQSEKLASLQLILGRIRRLISE